MKLYCGYTAKPKVDNTPEPCDGEFISDKCLIMEDGRSLNEVLEELSENIQTNLEYIRLLRKENKRLKFKLNNIKNE